MARNTIHTMIEYLNSQLERNADDIEWLNRILRKKRKIILTGCVTEEYSQLLSGYILALRAQNNRPIQLFINSWGGYVASALQLCDVIRSTKRGVAKVNAVVMGAANSSALDIVQACNKRIAWPRALFLLHGTDLGDKRIHDTDLSEFIRTTKKEDLASLEKLSVRSGQSMDTLLAWSRQSKVFNASEALKYGLIDEIKAIHP